jgi:hypothetical protein
MYKRKKEHKISVYKVDQRGKVVEQLKLGYDELIRRTDNKQYFYIEKKEQYYKLYFDIDYHYKYSFIQNYNDYTNKIIGIIIGVLNKIFVNPDTLYIYGKKDDGNGVHLYFNNLIVTQEIHTYILNEIYLQFMNIEKVSLKHIKQIIDYHVVCNGTLRLFYFNFKNGYYYPSVEQSTYNLKTSTTTTTTTAATAATTTTTTTTTTTPTIAVIHKAMGSNNKKEYLLYSIIKTDKKMHDILSSYYHNEIKNKKVLFFCKVMLPRL